MKRMQHFNLWVTVSVVLSFGSASAQERPELNIETQNGTPEEEQAVVQLLRLVTEYDVEGWLFTRDVLVDAEAIPHSHPVLTVNTRYLDDDLHQLTTLVHDQRTARDGRRRGRRAEPPTAVVWTCPQSAGTNSASSARAFRWPSSTSTRLRSTIPQTKKITSDRMLSLLPPVS